MYTMLGFFILPVFSTLFKCQECTSENKEFPMVMTQGRENIPILFT